MLGKSLHVGVLGLRHAELQHRKVIAHPHVALVESGGVAEIRRWPDRIRRAGFRRRRGRGGRVSLPTAVGKKLVGESSSLLLLLFLFGLEFLVSGGRRGGESMQLFQAGFAALWDAELDLGVEGARVSLGDRLGCHHHIVRSDWDGEPVELRRNLLDSQDSESSGARRREK